MAAKDRRLAGNSKLGDDGATTSSGQISPPRPAPHRDAVPDDGQTLTEGNETMISVFALLAYGVCATMHCAAPTQPPATVEVPKPTPGADSLAYSYDIIADRVIIHAKGRINLDEADNLNEWRDSLPVESQKAMRIGHITLSLDSPGGSVVGTESIMDWVKDNKVDTVVANGATCASACVMIWGAGAYKTASVHDHIGVHGGSSAVATNDDEKAAIEALATLAMARAIAAEKAPVTLVAAITTTSSEDMYWLKEADVMLWGGVVTDENGMALELK
jgi:ATP-dependent protease ClpP protease subunit